MATQEEQLDLIIELLRASLPDPLRRGWYEATISGIEERASHTRGLKYWQYEFELKIAPGRKVWGNFVELHRPDLRTVGAECNVFLAISDYTGTSRNIVNEVRRSD